MDPPGRRKTNNKEDVIATNDDAAVSKLSAVNTGYFKDEFVHLFVKRPARRPPLINRGYASRVIALDLLIKQFVAIQPELPKQIISLGAGFDTTFWKLKLAGVKVNGYFEVDFPGVVANKSQIIAKHNILHNAIPQFTKTDTEVNGEDYHLFAADLNNIPALESALEKAGVNFSLPTFFMSECVMIYIAPEKGNELIKWAGTKFPVAAFATYEQINPNDPFGDMMVKNLENKGCGLLSIHAFPDIPSQRQRYKDCGWDRSEVLDMNQVYNNFLPKQEVQRIARLEMFDEVEEWYLIQGHYCIVLALKDNAGGEFWKDIQFESTRTGR